MRKTLIAVAALAGVAANVTVSTKAEARCYGCWAGAAIAAGLIGSAIVANRAYGYGYYGGYGYGGYGGYYGGYAPAYYAPVYSYAPAYSYAPDYYGSYYYPRRYYGYRRPYLRRAYHGYGRPYLRRAAYARYRW